MLVCPQCQFENPNTNKFCQKCGTSLTHKTCYVCDTQVLLNEEHCPSCGTFTATVWWAVISSELDWQQEKSALVVPDQPAVAATSETLSEPSELETSVAEDEQNFNSGPVLEGTVNESSIEANILNLAVPDNSPNNIDATQTNTTEKNAANSLKFSSASSESTELLSSSTRQSDALVNNEQQTPEEILEATKREEEEALDSGAVSSEADFPDTYQATSSIYLDPGQRYRLLEPLPALPNLGESGVKVKVLDTQPFQKSPLEALTAWNAESPNQQSEMALGIPAIAQPYLSLQAQFYPDLPQIHDAWYQDGTSVILLEDRSQWPMLGELWGNKNLPMLQILDWLDEMVKLWSALESWKCRQSLLELTNLRVDEDQMMSLQQLYREPKDATLTLQDLGEMWQKLSQQSQRTQFTSLDQLFRDLRLCEIVTVEQLRARLEAIAHELESEAETEAELLEQGTLGVRENVYSSSPSNPENPISESGESDDLPTVILPMQVLSLEDAGATDTGRLREHNEDYFGIYTQSNKEESPKGRKVQARGLYVLCDGMGGHSDGEIASKMALEHIKSYFQANWQEELPNEKTIQEAVLLANQAIYDVNQQNSRSSSGRMGTTLVIVLIQETKVAVAHVGDSRLYRLSRKRGLEQVTVDHEVGQREIQRGVERAIAYSRPDAYQLTQALGPRDGNFVNPDIQFMELNEDTLLLLCSDGLSDHDLLEKHWQTHLSPLISSRANLEQGVLQLIELANQQNGHDNITAVLVRAKVRPNLDQQ